MRPGAFPVGLALVLALAIPSAVYLWHYSDLPQFCDFHDDCIYYVSAKSLASGHGYRIESLPGQPAQTKHTPLYPLLLSVAWRIDPDFPDNLSLAAWISWLALPATLMLLAWYTARTGMDGLRGWLLLGLFAVNPYVIWFSSQLLSELMFMALLFAAMLLLDKDGEASPPVAVVAGAIAGLAYLARSAGIALLPAAFLYLWMRGQRRQAFLFAAAMAPFTGGWMLWAGLHMTGTDDPALIYYLDYAAYERLNVSVRDLHLYLWKNADGLLFGLGSLVLPRIMNSLFMKILAEVIAVAMISGIWRLVKRGRARLYATFAAANSALLLIWHFPPDERFVLPLFPLALAGLITELGHFAALLRASLRHRDVGQRMVAAGMAGGVAVVLGGALLLQAYIATVLQPEQAREARARRADERAAYAWVRSRIPGNTRFLAYADPRFYLYTGNPVIRQSLPPKLWYHEDHAGTVELWGNLAPFAREHGLKYYFFQPEDLTAATEAERDAIEFAHRERGYMKPVFQQGGVTIYEFKN
jgi:MFS family permease